jgi:enoyl-CoA hydratase/carnithine racemase
MSEPACSPRINVSVRDNVATVEIDNPTQRNALTKAMCLAIQDMMPKLEADPDINVVVLRGTGNTFCAGAAIGELSSVLLDRQDDNTVVDHLSRADLAISSITKPTVALVDGACMGGGWQIASACDFIIASERSAFAITPAKIGIIYPRTGIERLVRLVGHANAKFILLTGQTFTAAQAQALGLVAETVPDHEFNVRSGAVVRSVGSRSRFSTHSMKRLVNLTATSQPRIDEEWDDAWAAMLDSHDMGIGVNAFLNGIQPAFTWRPGGQ